ncbi:MAG: GNAT family N-acetyltransferase [Candidatus Omnitrophica bacterium]|nr:GNAT family N-acetyltransferase [Candidatus Omnitrophota bacterium]
MIHENDPDHYPAFIALNQDWIQEYFELEPIDLELARDPSSVVRNGGSIFTLTEGDEVVSVCALFKKSETEYELARMATKKSARGKGYGRQVLNYALEKAKTLGAKKVYLVSNTTLKPALHLYEAVGFKTTHIGQDPFYKRADIRMEMEVG